MGIKKFHLLKLILLTVDFIAVNTAFVLAFWGLSWKNVDVSGLALVDILSFNVLWLVCARIMRLYYYETLLTLETIFRQSWRTILIHGLSFAAFMLLFNDLLFAKKFLFISYAILATFFIISRFFLTYVVEFILKKANFQKKIAIVGYNEQGLKLAEYFKDNNSMYLLEGFFDDKIEEHFSVDQNGNIVGPIEHCVSFALHNNIREIYSTLLPDEHDEIPRLLETAEKNCIRVKFVPAQNKELKEYYAVDYFNNMPVITHRQEPLQKAGNVIKKRIFDIVVSIFAILFVLSWLTPILALIIKLTSRGPVFFAQQRSGKDNESFWCLKFRSMTVNTFSDELQASKNDSRITKIGALMRKTSIDELPQFFNVLVGNMSICGPRPHMLKHTELYRNIIDDYMVRHFLKPGITGWAQVNGYRGETETPDLMVKRVEHDIWYLENWSLMLDIKILFMTVINIFKGEEKAY